MSPRYSIILPVHNEEGVLPELHSRLTDVMKTLPGGHELIFVDDGSGDDSVAILRAIQAADPGVRVLCFSRNFGHHVALTAGMDAARGERLVLMDADLQDRPEVIPDLVAKLEEGFDVVQARAPRPAGSLFKGMTSRLFFGLMRALAPPGVTVSTGVYRIMTRRVADAVLSWRERSPFLLANCDWVGFRQTSVAVERGRRGAGRSQYSLGKMVRLAVAGITASSTAPLQAVTYIGGLSALGAAAAGVALAVGGGRPGPAFDGWGLVLVTVLSLGAVQMLGLGILGAYVARIHRQTQGRPLYIIAERWETAAGEADPEADSPVEDHPPGNPDASSS